jgi:hypothetical protein
VFGSRRRAASFTAVALCGIWFAGSVPAREVAFRREAGGGGPRREIEHVYRIVGKVRLLFFWLSADNVGGARIVWRGDERDHTVSLLIGSEPARAPRGINEWGYVREHVAADTTTVFGIRTLADGESPDEAEANRVRAGGLAEFGVLCSTISSFDVQSRTTTIYVPPDTTYRHADRVLDAVEGQAPWNRRGTPRPKDAAPGFLTALDRLMRTSAPAARTGAIGIVPPQAYVYKDAIYDLIPRSVVLIPELRTISGSYRLLRAEISVRNRATSWTTSFSITYGTDGALEAVPVSVRYQPNWWFKVELELDDKADVPPDPAGDVAFGALIARICSNDAAVRTESR